PTATSARCAACHQSSGSCSAQPGRGVESGYPSSARASTLPRSSIAIALTPVVPTSMPTIGSAAMDVREVRPGLCRWTARHPEGADRLVACAYLETPEAVVLVDPLVPREEAQRFFEALDRDVARADRPVAVVLTNPWHRRSADTLAQRYDG